MTSARAQGGFTLIEIMVSLVLLVIGLLGIMALQATTVRGNRRSRELERARVLATAAMEDLRGRDFAAMPVNPDLGDFTTEDGVTYHRKYQLADVGGANLKMITVTVSFAENGDTSDMHQVSLQMIRTTLETM